MTEFNKIHLHVFATNNGTLPYLKSLLMYCFRNSFSLSRLTVQKIDHLLDYSSFGVYADCPKFFVPENEPLCCYTACSWFAAFSVFRKQRLVPNDDISIVLKNATLRNEFPNLHYNDFLRNTHIVFHLSSQRALTKSDNDLTLNYANCTILHIPYFSIDNARVIYKKGLNS